MIAEGTPEGTPEHTLGKTTQQVSPETIRLASIEPELEKPAPPIVPAFPAKQPQPVGSNGLMRVHFAFDSAGLDAETRRALDANIAILRNNPNMTMRLEGHTDETGTSAYNLGLGMRRSQTVRDYLVEQGIHPDRLITATFGEEMPIRRSPSTESYRINRRVEFGVVNATAGIDRTGTTHATALR